MFVGRPSLATPDRVPTFDVFLYLVPRRFENAVALYKAALREELWTPLDPRVSKAQALETYFRERKEEGGHTCATLLLGQGVHPRIVMETLGHS